MTESRRVAEPRVSLALFLIPMIVSGYLIQTAVGGAWRNIWVAIHLAASGLWLFGYVAHQATAVWSYLRPTSDQR